MIPDVPSVWLEIFGMIGTAGAIYGAIRADIRNIHRRIDEQREDTSSRLESLRMGLGEESRRIDSLFQKRG